MPFKLRYPFFNDRMLSGFFKELKRRNVLRMAVAYGVAAWLLLQVADVFSGVFGLPDWTLPLVGFLLLLGFVPTMILSWIYELTPDGLKRDAEVAAASDRSQSSATRLNILIIAGLSLAVVVLLVDRRLTGTSVSESFGELDPLSIAVLPFDDFSPARDQGWFADGLADELLNALTRVPNLIVASRSGSFRFRDTQLPVAEIAEQLRVAHILDGSVRRSGDMIRVSAQLIRTYDDRHLWADNFDGTADNIIAIQEEIALAIASALTVAMDPEVLRQMIDTGTRSVEAYEWFLKGQELGNALVSPDELADYAQRSKDALERAIEADPEFARAHHQLALHWLAELDPAAFQSSGSGDTNDVLENFITAINAAIEHAPSELDRLHYQGVLALGQSRFGEAKRLLTAYLDSGVSDFSARFQLIEAATRVADYELATEHIKILEDSYGDVSDQSLVSELYYRVGRPAEGARVAREVVVRDPTSAGGLYHAHRALLWAGEIDEAASLYERYAAIDEETRTDPIAAIRQACAEGRLDDAKIYLEQIASGDSQDAATAFFIWHAESLMMSPLAAANALAQRLGDFDNVFGLSGMMLYPHFDPSPFPELQALITRESIVRPTAISPPFACPLESH
ncbi:MAG: hypothetical protein V2J20_09125 [Wenzhouxiangella sp.]|nr:hypothetical protein [Wenzhouxiangella sp.]